MTQIAGHTAATFHPRRFIDSPSVPVCSPLYVLRHTVKMEASQVSFVILGLVLLVGVQTGSAIKCYVCNSGDKYDRDTCSDVDKLKKGDYLKDCGSMEVADSRPNGTYTMCRFYSQNVEGDYRVIRQCASVGRTDRCLERTGTKDIKVQFCHCDQDGCNSASGLFTPAAMVLSVVMAIVATVVRS